MWSARFDADASRLIAGASDGHVYVHDANRNVTTLRARAHADDVNAVAWADLGGDANVLYSGSDDATVKVWDARTAGFGENDGGVGGSSPRARAFVPAAVRTARRLPLGSPGSSVRRLDGPRRARTHLDSRGDGRYLISNCKDQTVKLWDVRKMVEPSAAERAASRRPTPAWNWDYRYMRFPAEGWDLRGPDDVSVQTYRGHVVDQTLIRTYFSPRETTGQRYLYSGSSDGRVAFWDAVSGERMPSGEEEEDDGGGEVADASARVGSARTLARVRRRRAREPRANRRRVTAPRWTSPSVAAEGKRWCATAVGTDETDARRRGMGRRRRAMGRGAVTSDARRRRGRRAWTGTERYARVTGWDPDDARSILVFRFSPLFPRFACSSAAAAARPAL